jgi:uncharacterized protein (TIGR02145 family)
MDLNYILSTCRLILYVSVLGLASCTEKDLAPVAITSDARIISQSEVIVSAVVNPKNQVTSVFFEYGITEKYGQIVNADPPQVGSSAEINVFASLSNLNSDTKYHYRVKAESLCGVTFGKDQTFVPTAESEILFNQDITYGILADREGNIYKTVVIGHQTWMAENLRTTIFSDGKPIPLIPEDNTLEKPLSPGYSWYKNDPDIYNYKNVYGALYNFYTVQTGKLCPTGWHVPSEQEWYTLFDYLGGFGVCAGKLKETGTTHWMTPNTGATNESGFTALPGGWVGSRGVENSSIEIRAKGFWWNTFEVTPGTSIRVPGLAFDNSYIAILLPDENNRCSVRCVKNN